MIHLVNSLRCIWSVGRSCWAKLHFIRMDMQIIRILWRGAVEIVGTCARWPIGLSGISTPLRCELYLQMNHYFDNFRSWSNFSKNWTDFTNGRKKYFTSLIVLFKKKNAFLYYIALHVYLIIFSHNHLSQISTLQLK